MKKIFTLFFMFFLLGISAQNKNYISQQVSEQIQRKIPLEKIPLFEILENEKINGKYESKDPNATLMQIDNVQLNEILDKKPDLIEITIPYNNTETTVVLIKNDFLPKTFIAKNNRGETIDYTPGIYYKGIIKGDKNSFVAFSFFKNDIIGIVTDNQNLKLSIVKSGKDDTFISFSNLFDKQIPMNCGADIISPVHNEPMIDGETSAKGVEKCVQMYYEISFTDYKIYNSNNAETLNWVTAVHNAVSAVYANENIASLIISEVYIWQEQDPYKVFGNNSEGLVAFFQSYRPQYIGNLAHLISSDVSDVGGRGVVGGLCGSAGYAFTSGLNGPQNINGVIEIASHEIGHNLGSLHTHDCVWNGNNTAIDGCAPPVFGSCSNPGVPDVGTIMSYCFPKALQFGEQPANLMRNYVANATCLQFNCSLAQFQIITEINDANGGVTGGAGTYYSGTNVTILAIPFAEYVFLRWERSPLNSNEITYLYDDRIEFYIDKSYKFKAVFQYVGLPETGNNVRVNVISNPTEGGVTTGSGIYQKGESYTVTAVANSGYTLESWRIVDFENQSVIFPPMPSLTITAFYNYNMIANFTPSLSVGNSDFTKSTLIYPNPTSHYINFTEEIKSAKVYDLSGKLLQTAGSVKRLDISNLQTGMYTVIITDQLGKTKSTKIIKN